MSDCKIKVLTTDIVTTRTPWGATKHSHVTRDCTVGKVYDAKRLPKGTIDSDGFEVIGDDCVEFVDDVGDTVTTYPFAGIEILEEV